MTITSKSRPRTAAARQRRCLTCGEDFPSEGAHNRVCRKCKTSQVWRQGWL